MFLIHFLREIRGRWPTKRWWLCGALFGVFFLVASRAQASSYHPLGETEVVQQIQRYCSASWRNANVLRAEWDDCSQQVFSELLQRVPRRQLEIAIWQGESKERRELNRTIWRIIKRQRRSEASAMLNVSWRDQSRSNHAREPDDRLADIVQIGERELSVRQFRIVQMAAEGHSIADIAQALGISVARASDEKYRSIRKIRECIDIV